jgi:hypothetical protein
MVTACAAATDETMECGTIFSDTPGPGNTGGKGSGADTAACIRPANVSRFFDVQVRAMICKPWDFR